MLSNRNRRVIGTGITLIVLAVVGLVYAAWTTNGTGNGYAKATSAQDLTTDDVSASTTAQLYPGGTGDVIVKVNNPNPFPVRVTAIEGNGAITADAGHAGCTTTGVTFTDQTGLTMDIAANSSNQRTFDDAAAMDNTSSNGCQGATFTIPVDITGASNAS